MHTEIRNVGRIAGKKSIAGWAALVLTACSATGLTGCQQNTSKSSGSAAPTYETGRPLGNFVGNWTVTGWVLGKGGEHQVVNGTARLAREKNYFVRMDVTFSDPTNSNTVEGTSIFGQTGGREVELTTWFSSSPTMRRYTGTMSADGKVFDFNDPRSSDPRHLKLKVIGPDAWDAEVWRGGQQVELYNFVRG